MGDDLMSRIESKRSQRFYVMTQEQELEMLEAKYPPEWMAELGNSGKQLLLFDKSQ
jgi:hypothetical protein